jgi:hypothetical protein
MKYVEGRLAHGVALIVKYWIDFSDFQATQARIFRQL